MREKDRSKHSNWSTNNNERQYVVVYFNWINHPEIASELHKFPSSGGHLYILRQQQQQVGKLISIRVDREFYLASVSESVTVELNLGHGR